MKRYLTIGSMCDLKGDENNTKYLIIGYKKNGKDYEAVLFPGGTTDGKSSVYFNTDDIDEVYDLGYKDKEAIQYLKQVFEAKILRTFIPKQTVSKKDEGALSSPTDLYDIKNDYFGIEVDESKNQGEKVPFTVKDVPETLKFKFDENGVVIADETAVKKNNASLGKFKFDENGRVVEDNSTEKVESPKTSSFKFDENGVVIADETAIKENNASLGKFKFDENGRVVEDNSTEKVESSKTSGFKFDENGVVIADETSMKVNNTPIGKFKFDENGRVVEDNSTEKVNSPKTGGFKFDENGIVTMDASI